jgi:hypothetical protein
VKNKNDETEWRRGTGHLVVARAWGIEHDPIRLARGSGHVETVLRPRP